MNDVIFTSYCFGNSAAQGDYKPQQDRLRDSILSIYPNANLHFVYEAEETGKPAFQKSMYGFKVKMVNECRAKGYKKIVYLDTAITLVDRTDSWLELAKTHGVLAIRDKNTLENFCSEAAMKYVGLDKSALEKIHLVGGSIYVFDFSSTACEVVFKWWEKMENDGMFGTQEDCSAGKLGGHRMDETCMALTLDFFETPPMSYEQMGYGYLHPGTGLIVKSSPEQPIIALKRHFK